MGSCILCCADGAHPPRSSPPTTRRSTPSRPRCCPRSKQTQASFAGVRAMHYRTLSFREQRGADITELLLRTHSLGLRTCLLKNDPARLEPFTPEYATLVTMAEQVIAKFPDRPSLLVDLGVILTLYHPAEACQDFTVRWRALQALRSWLHNEGAFDSLVVSNVLWERFQIKLKVQVATDLRSLLGSDVRPKEFDTMVNRQVEDQLRLITGNEDRELAQAGAYLSHAIDSDHSMKSWTCGGRLLNLKAQSTLDLGYRSRNKSHGI